MRHLDMCVSAQMVRSGATHPIVDSEKGLKLFVTNRNTRLDFPTPVSPRSTTFTSCALLAMALTNAFRAEALKIARVFKSVYRFECMRF